MKNTILTAAILALGFISCNGQQDTNKDKLSMDIIQNTASASESSQSEAVPEFEFEEEVYEFGEVSQGEKVEKTFTFRNIGGAPLIISDAKGSCGCTVPQYPRDPIPPGGEGIIKVIFDSNGKKGKVHNTVTLVANTVPNKKVLAIKGNVLTPNN